ncbi:MAG: class I tRNA ligase family protein, partial [Microvirga sp.]
GSQISIAKTQVFVAESEGDALQQARDYYNKDVVLVGSLDESLALTGFGSETPPEKLPLWRDEDVLDTWFSSALWPFSTLGWPDQTSELERYYPTDTLVTGFDIIFFWVARMMMMGLHFMKEVPFRTVYIHALVRDERGAKMSKSKGNIIDPLELIDRYGADALRFTLAAQAAQGRDIKLSIQRVEGNRNFATKIWNAARFAEMNSCAHAPGFDPRAVDETLNRWILGETAKAVDEVTQGIVLYKFNEAAGAAYRFVWNVFCDWYLELAKPVLQGADGAAKDETRASVAFVLDQICKLLHPFMPFLTEELWASTSTPLAGAFPSPLAGEGREGGPGDFAPEGATRADSSPGGSTLAPDPSPQGGGESSGPVLALAPWPALEGLIDEAAEAELGWVVELISEIRSARSETNVPAGAQIPLLLVNPSAAARARATRWDETIRRLARLSAITVAESAPRSSVQLIVRGEVAALPLEGVVDLEAEVARLDKERAKLAGDIDKIDAKLANADFLARAPEEIVDEQRERRDAAEARRRKIEEALARLNAGMIEPA